MVVHLLLVQYWLDTLMTVLGGGEWGGDWYKGGGGAKRFFKRVPKRFFLRVLERILRVPKQLPDPLIQGAAHLNAKNDFLKTLHKEMYQNNMMNILVILHAHMSYALMCSMVVHLLLVQYWLDTLMTLLGGGGWSGDWYKGGGWAPQQLIQGWWWVGWWC